MSGIQKFQRVNLQIIKAYKFQRYPLVSVCLDHQEGTERLYFGNCEEPSNRLAAFHDLSLFVNKAYYYVHRNTQEVYQGLIPIMYNSFYRNQFTNMVFLGPSGISAFLVFTRYLLGIRNVAFGGLDLNKEMNKVTQKLGLGNKSSFIELAKLTTEPDVFGVLENINKFVRDNTSQYVIPKKLINDKKQLQSNYFRVVPLNGENPNLFQYLVLFNVEEQMDYDLFSKLGIPLSRIPEIKEGKYIKDGQTFTIAQLTKYNPQLLQQAILILDFQNTQEIHDYATQAFTKFEDELKAYSNEFYSFKENQDLKQSLVIIHYADKELLESQEYINLIQKFKQIDYKIYHIIVTQEYYHILDKESVKSLGREQFSYYYMDYLKHLKNIIPKLVNGRDIPNQFQKSNELSDLNQLWPNENKYLPMKMKTIQIAKGNIFFEDLEVKRQIQYSMKKDDAILLQQLYNKMKNSIDNQYFKICMLGTSSSIETQSRNASSIHVQLPTVSLLLDCGQNTINQLFSCSINDEEFINKLKAIDIIYISHFHNDHHQGLFEFIKHKCKYTKEPFYILIPRPLFVWYHTCLTNLFIQEYGTSNYQDQVKLLLTQCLALDHEPKQQQPRQIQFYNLESDDMQFSNFDEKSMNFDQLKLEFLEFLEQKQLSIDIIYTAHCQQSTSIKVKYEGKTLVYSSDRLGKLLKYGNKFSSFAQNCDILIHECTYPEEMIEKAIKVKHSTIFQAFFTGYFANAKNLVLTHFTERSLFSLKTLFHSDGNIIEQSFKRQIQQSNESNQPYNIDEACNYFKNNVVMANDFMTFGEQSIQHMSQISRIISKSLIP